LCALVFRPIRSKPARYAVEVVLAARHMFHVEPAECLMSDYMPGVSRETVKEVCGLRFTVYDRNLADCNLALRREKGPGFAETLPSFVFRKP